MLLYITSILVQTLVDVKSVEIKNKRAQKYLTVDTLQQIQREKNLKNQHMKRKALAERMREEDNFEL